MSDQQPHLAMYLAGPMQAWGHASRYTRRTTLPYPTRSGLVGLIMAAMGASREDSEVPATLSELHCDVFVFTHSKYPQQTWTDYHTVGGGYDAKAERSSIPRKANNATPNTVLTSREYLADAHFGALLSGDTDLLRRILDALVNPVWGVWLGRKSCVPTMPVAQGIHATSEVAIKHLKNVAGENRSLTRIIREVDTFEDGYDSLMDVPLNFKDRTFTLRRIAIEDQLLDSEEPE